MPGGFGDIEVHVARLYPDKIGLYETIHDGMTPEHAAATRRGNEAIDIYRLDDLLVMLVRRRRDVVTPPSDEDRERARQWHASLAECFAEPWRVLPMIFSLETIG